MKIQYFEVVEATDERASKVIARYKDRAIADAIAKMGSGWYGAANWVSPRILEISDATSLEEAKKDYLRNTPEYKAYLDVKKTVERLETVYGPVT